MAFNTPPGTSWHDIEVTDKDGVVVTSDSRINALFAAGNCFAQIAVRRSPIRAEGTTMASSSMPCRLAVGTILFPLILAAAPVAAADYSRWNLRLRALASDYQRDFTYSYQATSHLRIDNGAGFEAAAELRSGQHFGVEVAVASLGFDARTWTTELRPVSIDPLVFEEVTLFEDRGDFEIQPFTLALVFHPYSTRRLDSYVAPFAARARYRVGVASQNREAEFGYGAKIGLEYVSSRSPWGLGVEYRHLELPHETLDRDQYGSIGLDVASLVLSYRLGRRGESPPAPVDPRSTRKWSPGASCRASAARPRAPDPRVRLR